VARYRLNPLTPQDTPDLAPLQNSHEADGLEAELKALFKLMFDGQIRPAERTINTVGTPHIGPFDQVERAVKSEGLALQRRGGEDAMRYLFRAWRARNPKRGLHMLRAYLQVLWPNGWTMDQMWQDKAETYPTLTATDEGNHFLTSRVHVQISSGVSDGSDVLAVSQSLRSVLAARFLLNVSVKQQSEVPLGIATLFYAGAQVQSFEGEFYREDIREIDGSLGLATAIYKGAEVQTFTGEFTRDDAHLYMAPYLTGAIAESFSGTIS
jgi:hypothetical protein